MTTLLTVQEYALLFRVHLQTVYTAIRRQRLPFAVIRPAGGSAMLIQVPTAIVESKRLNNHAA